MDKFSTIPEKKMNNDEIREKPIYFILKISNVSNKNLQLYIPEILWILLFDEQIKENKFSTGSCLRILTPGNLTAMFSNTGSTSAHFWNIFVGMSHSKIFKLMILMLFKIV